MEKGTKINRLTALEDCKPLYKVYNFQCDCGIIKKISARYVKNGNTKSCGCFQKEKIKEQGIKNRKDPGVAGLNSLYSAYQIRANKKDIEFSLSLDEFKTFTSIPCYYCNSFPNQIRYGKIRTVEGNKNAQYKYNGLDRVDPNKGYRLGNIVPCCKTCNYAKHIMDIAEFLDWIKKVHKNCFEE